MNLVQTSPRRVGREDRRLRPNSLSDMQFAHLALFRVNTKMRSAVPFSARGGVPIAISFSSITRNLIGQSQMTHRDSLSK
jgi:hypothetical protein